MISRQRPFWAEPIRWKVTQNLLYCTFSVFILNTIKEDARGEKKHQPYDTKGELPECSRLIKEVHSHAIDMGHKDKCPLSLAAIIEKDSSLYKRCMSASTLRKKET